jgi:GT2 family glycosyltransferase
MSSAGVWLTRFGSRWRKWTRDPAAFCDELPSPLLRALAVGSMGLGVGVADLLGAEDRRARTAWRRLGVGLVQTDGEARRFEFLTADGAAPPVWPSRVLVGPTPEGLRAIAVAFGENGEATAAELSAGRAGLLTLQGRPARVSLYRTDEGDGLPSRLPVRPAGRGALVRARVEGGERPASALREAWPPVERRSEGPSIPEYQSWIRANEPGPGELQAIKAWAERLSDLPSIAVIMPVHDPRPEYLKAAIDSVRAQACSAWTLCIADDGSRSVVVRKILREAEEADPRIRTVSHAEPRGVVEATNAALALAQAEVVLFLDHDDELAPHALAVIGHAFASHPEAVAVYSDEDSIDAHGRRSEPRFKPDFDHERLLAQNYVNHAFAVRTALVRRLGGLRTGWDGVQDHDLVLRVAESGAGPILHAPHVLYHWRIFPGGGSFSQSAAGRIDAARVRLVAERLEGGKDPAKLSIGPRGHLIVARPPPSPAPRVTAIIPTRDHPDLLEACVAGLLEQTDYPALDLCVVDNGSEGERAQRLLERLARTPRVRVMRIDAPFNFSALNNTATAATDARLLAFVNDDILVVEPGWLKAMAALAVRPEVGAVGAKLLYPDGRIQHAGIVLGLGPHRVAGHEFRGAPGASPGPQNRLLLAREVSAVTAACMVVERERFLTVGGFDEQALPVAFNDVDLCLKLSRRGWRTLWTPQARLMHLESASRGSDRAAEAAVRLGREAGVMRERWGELLARDPYYNPNLTLADESFTLAAKSRAEAPWRRPG